MIISFNDLKYFFSSKIIFFLFASLWWEEFKRETLVLVPEIVTQTTAAQIEKGFPIPRNNVRFWLEFALFES